MRKSLPCFYLLLGTIVVAGVFTSLVGCSHPKTMPDLSKVTLKDGMSQDDITAQITGALHGLDYGPLAVVPSETRFHEGSPAFYDQDPKPGKAIDAKTPVTVYIEGTGVKVPVVSNQPFPVAVNRLVEAGLPFAVAGNPTVGFVVGAAPPDGSVVAKGTVVVLNMPFTPVGSAAPPRARWNEVLANPALRSMVGENTLKLLNERVAASPTPPLREIHLPGSRSK